MVKLEQEQLDEVVGEIPHSCVDFVAVPGSDRNIREQVQTGDLEIIAENSDKHPDHQMIVRRAIKPAVIVAGGVALGAIAIGVYKLYKDPNVERVAAEMREKLQRKRQRP